MKPIISFFIVAGLFLSLAGCPGTGETPEERVTYSGNITLPADSAAAGAAWYVLVKNLATGGSTQTAVNFSGSSGNFSIEDTRGSGNSMSHIYLYNDSDGDGEMNFLNDRAVFLMAQNNYYSNDVIDIELITISGSLADPWESGSDKLVRVENKTYWVTTYLPLPTGGNFEVMAVEGHTIDLSLLRGTTESAATDVVEETYFGDRVRLFTPYTFNTDTIIHSPDSEDEPLNLRTITLTCRISEAGYDDYPLYIRAGQDPLVIPATNNEGEQLYGEKTAADMTLSFYFRDFDRTTATAGALPDASREETTEGYGAFFQASVFIDINRDGVYNPGEPVSDTYFLGDADGNGVPDWEPSGEGDFNDNHHFSGIDGDLDLSAGGFLFEL